MAGMVVRRVGTRMVSTGVVACAAGVAFLVVLGVALLEMARFGGAEGVEEFLVTAGNVAIFSVIPLVLIGAWLLDRLDDRSTAARSRPRAIEDAEPPARGRSVQR